MSLPHAGLVVARTDKYDVAKRRKSKSLYGNVTIVHEERPLNSPLLCMAYFPVAFWAVSQLFQLLCDVICPIHTN